MKAKFGKLCPISSEAIPSFVISIVSAFIWGLLAHTYCFTNLTLSHDSINEQCLFGSTNYLNNAVNYSADSTIALWKVSLGRFLEPVYQLIFRGPTVSPWLVGILSLLWLALSVWITVRMFSIEHPVRIALVSAIFTVNITVTAIAATYITDLDSDMFAVFMATLAAYFWSKGGKKLWLGVPCVTVLLALYQSMLSVTITLIMMSCIQQLINNSKTKEVIISGLKAILMIIIGGILYLLFVKVACYICDISLDSGYNGLTGLWSSKGNPLKLFALTYVSWGYYILCQASVWPVYLFAGAVIILALFCIVIFYFVIKSKSIEVSGKVLVIVLCFLLPFGMNISYFLDGGLCHDLMKFAIWFVYLLAIVFEQWFCANKEHNSFTHFVRFGICIIIAALMWSNVQTANAAYVKKDLERQATLSTMTKVTYSIEQTDGYIPGETKVIFYGMPSGPDIPEYGRVYNIMGCNVHSQITGMYKPYYEYILQYNINMIADSQIEDMEAYVALLKTMPVFPKKGSIQWLDDEILVVRMG